MAKKPGIAIAILGKQKDDEEKEKGNDYGKKAKTVAAKSLISAINSGDADAVVDAFQDMVEFCS